MGITQPFFLQSSRSNTKLQEESNQSHLRSKLVIMVRARNVSSAMNIYYLIVRSSKCRRCGSGRAAEIAGGVVVKTKVGKEGKVSKYLSVRKLVPLFKVFRKVQRYIINGSGLFLPPSRALKDIFKSIHPTIHPSIHPITQIRSSY